MTSLEIFTKAREILSDPNNWTKHAFARTKDGEPLWDGSAKGACKWCLTGVLDAVVGKEQGTESREWRILRNITCGPPTIFNDACEHADVLEVLDKAIAQEKADDAA